MMKFAVLSTLLCSASAFAPAAKQVKTTAVNADFSKELGAMTPLGFYDPMGVCDGISQERFDSLRTTEIKHGRIAMLAVSGYLITAAGIRFPGAEDVPDGLAAFPSLYSTDDGKNVLLQMIFFFGLAEIVNSDVAGVSEFPGDWRNGALDFGWDLYDDATKTKKRTIELNQGRAAMMGITGLVTHEYIGASILPGGYLPGH